MMLFPIEFKRYWLGLLKDNVAPSVFLTCNLFLLLSRRGPFSCYLPLVTYFVSFQSIWKTVPLNLVQSPYQSLATCRFVAVRLEDGIFKLSPISLPVPCDLSFRRHPSGRRYLDNRVCWNGPAVPTCPDTRTSNVRLENATSQPCSSVEPRKDSTNQPPRGR